MQSLSTSFVSLHSVGARTKTDEKSTKKTSIFYFLALFYSFLCLGLGAGLIGPSLLKFGEHLNEPMTRTIYILLTRSIGFLIGTLFGGSLIDYFSNYGRTFVTISVFLMGVSTALVPLMSSLGLMIFVHAIWSLSAGVVDNLAQILTIRSYPKDRVNAYLQAIHSAFGLGAFLSPLIMGPLIGPNSLKHQWFYAYWILGVLHLPIFVWILFYAIRDECLAKKMSEPIDEEKPMKTEINDQIEITEEKLTMKKLIVLILTMLFILLYVGGESAFGAYIHTYATLHVEFKPDRAAYLNSAFWAAFALSRLLGILLSMKFSALKMITGDIILSIVSLTAMLFWNQSILVSWLGSILFGIGAASIYASIIAYTEKTISITGKRMSLLAVGGSAGDALIPFIVGILINSKSIGPIGFIASMIITTFASALLFLFIVLFSKQNRKLPEQIQT